jgi:hypothetical protein
MPIAWIRRVNTPPKALSLSRTTYVGALSQGNASVIWRANHSAVGCRITANHSSCRRPWPRNKKCQELLKGNRRNYKEMNRRDPVSVVAKEGCPGLRRSTSPRDHVRRDGRLGDVEAELQKLAVDVRRPPERVLETHSSNKVAHLFVDPRSATERAGLPSPERSETLAVPTHDRLGSDDRYGVKDWDRTDHDPKARLAPSPRPDPAATRGGRK